MCIHDCAPVVSDTPVHSQAHAVANKYAGIHTHTEAEAQMYLSNQHIHIHKSNKLFLAGGCMWLSHQRAVESDVLGPRPTCVFN